MTSPVPYNDRNPKLSTKQMACRQMTSVWWLVCVHREVGLVFVFYIDVFNVL